MFFLDSESRITRIAGSLADWLDGDPASFTGEPVTELVASADIDTIETALARVRASQTSQTVACHFEVNDTQVPVDIEFAPVVDASTLGDIIGTVERGAITEPHVGASPSDLAQLRNFIELLDDATVVFEMIDSEPIVRAVNPAFEDTFGYPAAYIAGESLNEYIVPAEYQRESARFDKQVADGDVTQELVTRRTASGLQEFSYRGLPIQLGDDTLYGVATYADITNEQQAKQHVQVLHRVLRHNVRNELTVVLGMAEKIRTEAESREVETAADRIIEHAEDLDTVSEKARLAESLLGESPSDTVVELGNTASNVVAESRRQWPDATIEADIETPLPVSTGLELSDVIENLVENAIIHNTESPTVRVTGRVETPIHATTRGTGQNAIVTIEDDGPGIPDPDRAVVFGGEDMTDLRHGSGLGLWVARWIVESADGVLSYERADGWTTVTIRLPLASDLNEVSEHEQT